MRQSLSFSRGLAALAEGTMGAYDGYENIPLDIGRAVCRVSRMLPSVIGGPFGCPGSIQSTPSTTLFRTP
jgi:hypothetical protein